MRRLFLLALLVPLAAGCGWASALFGGRATSQGSSRRAYVTTVTLHTEGPSPVPRWVELERLPKKAIRGARVFYSAGCLACHRYAGSGSKNLGAPPLTAIGSRHLGIRFQIVHLRCPACVNPGSPMPPFTALGHRRRHELAVFLEASRGIH